MELAGVLFILILLATIGVVVYLMIEFNKHRLEISTTIQSTQTALDEEKNTRLSNLKYVVDQVNTVNDEIFSEYTSNLTPLKSLMDTYQRNISFSSNQVNLMTDVTTVMGLTAKDLSTTGNIVQFCSKDDATRCIRFPNSNGDTELIALDPTKRVVVNSPLAVSSASAESMRIGTGFTSADTTPATLHVKPITGDTKDIFAVEKSPYGKVFSISTDGQSFFKNTVNLSAHHSIKLQNANNVTVATIGLNAAGNGIVINGPVEIPNLVTRVVTPTP